jgi:hypothetical protein
LHDFMADHEELPVHRTRARGALPSTQTEIIDLTRGKGRLIGGLLGRARKVER